MSVFVGGSISLVSWFPPFVDAQLDVIASEIYLLGTIDTWDLFYLIQSTSLSPFNWRAEAIYIYIFKIYYWERLANVSWIFFLLFLGVYMYMCMLMGGYTCMLCMHMETRWQLLVLPKEPDTLFLELGLSLPGAFWFGLAHYLAGPSNLFPSPPCIPYLSIFVNMGFEDQTHVFMFVWQTSTGWAITPVSLSFLLYWPGLFAAFLCWM